MPLRYSTVSATPNPDGTFHVVMWAWATVHRSNGHVDGLFDEWEQAEKYLRILEPYEPDHVAKLKIVPRVIAEHGEWTEEHLIGMTEGESGGGIFRRVQMPSV